MAQTGEIVNRVEKSGLITVDLAEYYDAGERVIWDMADYLFQGMILREKEYRKALKEMDWSAFDGKNVAVMCSSEAIIPTWAYMLTTTYLSGHANKVVMGDLDTLEYALFRDAMQRLDTEALKDARVVVKGCGEIPIPASAYVELTAKLLPVVTSLMYGEPCSTVPVYKRPRRRA